MCGCIAYHSGRKCKESSAFIFIRQRLHVRLQTGGCCLVVVNLRRWLCRVGVTGHQPINVSNHVLIGRATRVTRLVTASICVYVIWNRRGCTRARDRGQVTTWTQGVFERISTGLERLEWSETTRGRSLHSKLFVSIQHFQATEQPTRTDNNPTDFCGGTAQLAPKTGVPSRGQRVLLTQRTTFHESIAQGKPQSRRCEPSKSHLRGKSRSYDIAIAARRRLLKFR